MVYTAKYFKEQLPEWKKKKDPILSQIFYRPLSFYVSSIATKFGISANAISYFSALLGIIACVTFLFDNGMLRIIGAILIHIWLILDCADGNIARHVKKQPFGEFADGISSYILVGLLCTAMGVSVYHTGGILFESGNYWIILLGALASSSDSLMRLIYQKFRHTEQELQSKGMIKGSVDERHDVNQVSSFKVRVETELGIGGILPTIILCATLFNFLDLVVLYCFLYYGLACMVSSLLLVRKAMTTT